MLVGHAFFTVAIEGDGGGEIEGVSAFHDLDAGFDVHRESRAAETIAVAENIPHRYAFDAARQAQRKAPFRHQRVTQAAAGEVLIGDRHEMLVIGRRTGGGRDVAGSGGVVVAPGQHIVRIFRVEQIEGLEEHHRPREDDAIRVQLDRETPATVPRLDGLVHRMVHRAARREKSVGHTIVAGRGLQAETQLDVALRLFRWIPQPRVAAEAQITDARGMCRVAHAVKVGRREL